MKRFIKVLLSLCVLVCFVGCNSNKVTSSTAETSPVTIPQEVDTTTESINGNNEGTEVDTEATIENVIDEVFSGLGYSYNILLEIKTKEKDYLTSLVAKTKTNLITIDNEVIPISEVISIKRKKN